MKAMYDTAYLAIFLTFIRRLCSKLVASLTYKVPFHKEGDTGPYYVLVSGMPYYWFNSKEECLDFCYRVIGKAKSLAGQLKIVESGDGIWDSLVDPAEIPGLCMEDVMALNDTVDELNMERSSKGLGCLECEKFTDPITRRTVTWYRREYGRME